MAEYVNNISRSIISQSIDYYTVERDNNVLYAIPELISIAASYYAITSDPSEKEYAKNVIRSLVNKWLDIIAPILYIPGLVDELSNLVDKRLWEALPDVTEDLLEKIMVETKMFKELSRQGFVSETVYNAVKEAYALHTLEFLEALSNKTIEPSRYPILAKIIDDVEDQDIIIKLATINAIALVLSTN